MAAGRSTRTTKPKGASSASAASGRSARRQGQATRDKLLAAAVPALAESGYHATRVDDVVRLAGVSHGTFYLYFANMEDLFRALAERCADDCAELAESLGEVPADDSGLAVLRAWLAEYLAFYRRYGVVIRAWAENQVTDRRLAKLGTVSFGRIATTLRASMGERVASGATASTPSAKAAPAREVELRADALLAMLERFSYVVTSRDLGFDEGEVLDDLSVLVHRGFFRAGR
ncbi:MAG TPA: TetR/AcrR family transcriptional regulator [Acidimicrobiales bacterium]|nr:TetR/AcrR family transcriptional regulator [Acidimicrobiales bacterium]